MCVFASNTSHSISARPNAHTSSRNAGNVSDTEYDKRCEIGKYVFVCVCVGVCVSVCVSISLSVSVSLCLILGECLSDCDGMSVFMSVCLSEGVCVVVLACCQI